jgi:hypothetical protein
MAIAPSRPPRSIKPTKSPCVSPFTHSSPPPTPSPHLHMRCQPRSRRRGSFSLPVSASTSSIHLPLSVMLHAETLALPIVRILAGQELRHCGFLCSLILRLLRFPRVLDCTTVLRRDARSRNPRLEPHPPRKPAILSACGRRARTPLSHRRQRAPGEVRAVLLFLLVQTAHEMVARISRSSIAGEVGHRLRRAPPRAQCAAAPVCPRPPPTARSGSNGSDPPGRESARPRNGQHRPVAVLFTNKPLGFLISQK